MNKTGPQKAIEAKVKATVELLEQLEAKGAKALGWTEKDYRGYVANLEHRKRTLESGLEKIAAAWEDFASKAESLDRVGIVDEAYQRVNRMADDPDVKAALKL